MNKPKNVVVRDKIPMHGSLPQEPQPINIKPASKNIQDDLIKMSVTSAAPVLLVEMIKSFRGINNNDIMKKLDVLLENQQVLGRNQKHLVDYIQKVYQ